MAKNRKIKTYKKIYQESSGPFSSPLGVVAMAVVIVVAAVVGWSAYAPVRDFVMGMGETPALPARPSSSATQEGQSPASGETETTPPADDTPPQEPTPPPAAEQIKAVFMPAQSAADLGRIDAFLGALPAGYNTVVVELKGSTGALYYKSSVPLAAEAGAVPAQGLDAAALAGRIRQAGYTPAARIHAFSDHLLPAYKREAAVMYMSTDWMWLDNAPELGGKPWLSPYSDVAQGYIADIATELARGGFSYIVADTLSFPQGVGIEKAGYGEAGQRTGRQAQLKSFANNLSSSVEKAGGQLVVYLPSAALFAPSELIYGGSGLDIYGGLMAVGMMPGSLQPGLIIGDTTLSDPSADPAATVAALFSLLPQDSRSRTIAYLQGAVGAAAADPAFVSGQIKGLPAGAGGYIVYNPQGSYRG